VLPLLCDLSCDRGTPPVIFSTCAATFTTCTLARVHGALIHLKLGLTTAIVISSHDTAREAFTRHHRCLTARAIPRVLVEVCGVAAKLGPAVEDPVRHCSHAPLHPVKPRWLARHNLILAISHFVSQAIGC
jgi:hypothetical protein